MITIYKIYAIQSLKDRRIYVGLTKNINQRFKEHNRGRVFSTKGYCPWRLIYTEECGSNRSEARKREIYLKSGCGKEFLKKINNK
jgi:putative endonuclease